MDELLFILLRIQSVRQKRICSQSSLMVEKDKEGYLQLIAAPSTHLSCPLSTLRFPWFVYLCCLASGIVWGWTGASMELWNSQKVTKSWTFLQMSWGLARSLLTIFQVFSDLLKSNCGLPLRTFSSKCFMFVYFKKNIGLVFLGPRTLRLFNEFVSLFSVQDALWDSKEVVSPPRVCLQSAWNRSQAAKSLGSVLSSTQEMRPESEPSKGS